jgi:hypothetical protein
MRSNQSQRELVPEIHTIEPDFRDNRNLSFFMRMDFATVIGSRGGTPSDPLPVPVAYVAICNLDARMHKATFRLAGAEQRL